MSIAAVAPPPGPTTPADSAAIDPALLNGDSPLTGAQRRAYLRYHAGRNARNASESRRLDIRSHPAPWFWPRPGEAGSPARIALAGFLRAAACRLHRRLGAQPVTILDLGCGSGRNLRFFEAAGFRGEYVGIDLSRHRRWSDEATGAFSRRLILGDAATLDLAALPTANILLSCTSLEHIADDGGALQRLRTRLAPGAAEVHCVPGEAALPLYGTHGWRQYSPACLRVLFPDAEIYRGAGALSAWVHRRYVRPREPGGVEFMKTHPRAYRALCIGALAADRALGNRRPVVYGVIVGG